MSESPRLSLVPIVTVDERKRKEPAVSKYYIPSMIPMITFFYLATREKSTRKGRGEHTHKLYILTLNYTQIHSIDFHSRS